MTKPIKPSQVKSVKRQKIPDQVIEIFNDLIAKNWNGSESVILLKDAATAVATALDVERKFVFDNNYLDVEDIFKHAGWKVEFDKPAYGESYEAYFRFKK